MTSRIEPPPAGAEDRRSWRGARWRIAVACAFLVYLLFVGLNLDDDAHGAGEIVGYAVLAAFAALYLWLIVVDAAFTFGEVRFWSALAAMGVLFVAELPFARAVGFVMCPYIVALATVRVGVRAAPLVAVLALAALFVPAAVPSWHTSVGDSFAMVTPVAIPIIFLVGLGILRLVESNRDLALARAEVARLGAETERARIARDLHDLLGHSLTTITVKAGLAHRLGSADFERAMREVSEIEQLARRSLHDVRAAVAGYREVTLAGELATGRELLRGAGVTAELPSAADVVEPAHQELFGWVVREGLTNVVRHARASSCVVRLSPAAIEILDDGVGAVADDGNGLVGLRERVAAAGGVVEAGPRHPAGWRLRVSLNGERP